ncbi:hypothetical protein ACLOJK_036549, partial [Asimina triloba]
MWKVRKKEEDAAAAVRCCYRSWLETEVSIRSDQLAHRIEEGEGDTCRGRRSRPPVLKTMEKGGELVVAAFGSGRRWGVGLRSRWIGTPCSLPFFWTAPISRRRHRRRWFRRQSFGEDEDLRFFAMDVGCLKKMMGSGLTRRH